MGKLVMEDVLNLISYASSYDSHSELFNIFNHWYPAALLVANKTCEGLGIEKPTAIQRQEQKALNEENSINLMKEIENKKFVRRGVREEYLEIVRDDITGLPLYDEEGNVKKELKYIDSFLIYTTTKRKDGKALYDFCKAVAQKHNQNRVLFFGIDAQGVYINVNGNDEDKPYIAFITDEDGNEHTIAYGDDEKRKYATPFASLENNKMYHLLKNKNGSELKLENLFIFNDVSSYLYNKYNQKYKKDDIDQFIEKLNKEFENEKNNED